MFGVVDLFKISNGIQNCTNCRISLTKVEFKGCLALSGFRSNMVEHREGAPLRVFINILLKTVWKCTNCCFNLNLQLLVTFLDLSNVLFWILVSPCDDIGRDARQRGSWSSAVVSPCTSWSWRPVTDVFQSSHHLPSWDVEHGARRLLISVAAPPHSQTS